MDNFNTIYDTSASSINVEEFNYPHTSSLDVTNKPLVENVINTMNFCKISDITAQDENVNISNGCIDNSQTNYDVMYEDVLNEDCSQQFSRTDYDINVERIIASSELYQNAVSEEVQILGQDLNVIDEDVIIQQKKLRLLEILENYQIGSSEQINNDFENTPKIDNYFSNSSLIELSRISWTNANSQNYLRGCKWSPDGTCILTAVNLNGMHIINLPTDLYYNENVSKTRPVDCLTTAAFVKENGLVYDYCWFPYMNSSLPETCFWLSTIQHSPIQLWNAFDGSLVSSYRGYNSVDEVESAISLIFSTNGTSIFGGYKNNIKIFDTERPGRDYITFKIKQPASSLSMNSDSSILAVGSWNRTITILSTNDGKSTYTLNGHKGGVTHLCFSPTKPLLFSGSRKDPLLQIWDLRAPSKPLHTLCRSVDTNQRIYFDISSSGRWLISGGTKGTMRVWDTDILDKEIHELNYPVHNDCCNGASFHPCRPILATSSGQHHFENIDAEDLKIQENSLIFWWIGSMNE